MYRLFFAISALSILACSDPDIIVEPAPAPAPLRLDTGSYDLVIREIVRSTCGDVGLDVLPVELSGRSPVELSLADWELSGDYRNGLLVLSGHPALYGGDDPVPAREGTVTVDEDGEPVDSGAPADSVDTGAASDDDTGAPGDDRPVSEDDCGQSEPNEGSSGGGARGEDDDGDATRGDEGDREPPRCDEPSGRAQASLTLRPSSNRAAEGLLEVRVEGCQLSARVALKPARDGGGPVVVPAEEPVEEPADDTDTDVSEPSSPR